MRLCTFRLHSDLPGQERMGIVKGQKVFEANGRGRLIDFIGLGKDSIQTDGDGHPIDDVLLYAPVPRPGKIVAAIVNSQAMLGGPDLHLDRPRLDMKAPSTVVGTGTAIEAPQPGIRPEVELAALIGRRLRGGSVEEAAASIAGYTILNDVTAPTNSKEDAYEAYRRDRATGEVRKTTMRGPLFRSKNHDSFCPMGPWLVTSGDVDVRSGLGMTTRFDSMLVQDGSTSEYLFSPEQIASYVSGFLTLEPGDVISCGSVGWTSEAMGQLDPTEFILPWKSGVLELEIQGIGRLTNPVVPV